MRQYSYSGDEENYHGSYDSPHAAAADGFADDPERETIFVGQNVAPPPPESYVDGGLLVDHVQEQDEYSDEWAKDWPRASKEQRDELTTALRKIFAEWLDRHDLRPAFFTVEQVRVITRAEVDAATKGGAE